ncbi:MAG: type-F conjugative transfer system secretin TraK [Campylobacterota bacterium]|nr:type-F conjugative transfer system secretin TraK [Campylobacterota bacterium]
MRKIVAMLGSLIVGASTLLADVVINDPGESIKINVSRSSMNRVVFPSKILSKQYSKEKGLMVKTYDNEAFLKYAPMVEQTSTTVGGKTTTMPTSDDVVYYKAKRAEVFFVTESGTYAIIFVPKKMSPQTIRINDTLVKKKAIIKYETRDPYKASLKKIAQETLAGNVPYGYEEQKSTERYSSGSLEVFKKRALSGTLYRAQHYRLFNASDKPVSLDERNYIALSKGEPLFLAVFYDKQLKMLSPLDSAELVIVERGGQND